MYRGHEALILDGTRRFYVRVRRRFHAEIRCRFRIDVVRCFHL